MKIKTKVQHSIDSIAKQEAATRGDPVVDTRDTREEFAKIASQWPTPVYQTIQEVFTLLTGKPYQGQKALFSATPNFHLLVGLSLLFLGAIASAEIITVPLLFPCLILSWALTVGGARMLTTVVGHYCVHKAYFKKLKFNRRLFGAISVLTLTQNWEDYEADHVKQHHSNQGFCTVQDPDYKFLRSLGFDSSLAVKGESTKPFWNHLFKTLVSPSFHMVFFNARLRSNLVTATLIYRSLAIAFNTAVFTTVVLTNSFVVFFVAWVFPLMFLYQVSSLLQFLSEHTWGSFSLNASKSHARFCGLMPPSKAGVVDWLIWGIQMVYHGIIRVSVLPGDLVVHNYHHLEPGKSRENWPNAIYEAHAYQLQIEANGGEYIEFWGIGKAIDHVFQEFANQSQSITEGNREVVTSTL